MAGREEATRAGGSLKRRSPDEVRVVRASGNEINFGEEIVMGDNSTAVSSVIPFRSAKLLLVERDGEPFVPMKPVVDGMGLDWKSQYAKLQSGRFNSTMVMITMVAQDGKMREMACLPLRKLAGWLMSIHASKVRPELRDGVIAYQNECDDALWSYWNNGHAVNHRGPGQVMTVLGQTIGTDGFHCLGAVLDGKVRQLPAKSRQRAKMHVWSQVHKAFSVVSAQDIPTDQFDSARNFIAAYVLEGEYLGPEKAKPPLAIHYPIEALTKRRPSMLEYRGDGRAWLDVSMSDICSRPQDLSLCEEILCELRDAGYEIDGAWFEVRSLRNRLHQLNSFLTGLGNAIQQPTRYGVSVTVGRTAA
ncbi:phage antirepressor N-terminal domain-containing protein [Pseudomonas sp. HMSC08G10]|uniref:phage antirepressor N-terminal domain-containing protein n=1 Tax=Pseudomonas sp. HMSC08G10 TaxID=1581141 RepID=UPI002114F439|nr:phage antirepressor N-terminal domain-containing protein [Pseudomonas sp. HMSC08G10]